MREQRGGRRRQGRAGAPAGGIPSGVEPDPVPDGTVPAPDRAASRVEERVADGAGALRCTVGLEEPLALDLAPDPGLADAARKAVTPLAVSAEDRAAGRRRYEAVVDGWRFEVGVEPALRAALRDRAQRSGTGQAATGRQVVRAQIPGRIVQVWVEAGDDVEEGARLCSLEAMKMENEIRAPRAGTIGQVAVEPGSRVELGDELVVIE